ncbi:hypothetical protein SEA_CHANGELING_89 [Mycobacterium phage Changeling]|nr:hypothetical protein SEA_CHANGELING_89 [Mycobacterium phage Changeling]
MHTMTVRRVRDDKTVTITASHRQALLDHLEASAKRNNIEVTWLEPREYGLLRMNGEVVGDWEVDAA